MAAIDLHVDPHPGASAAALVREITRRRFLGEYVDPERAAAVGRAWAERVLPQVRLLRVRARDSGHEHGQVWLLVEGDDLGVLALDLDDDELAPEVREQVVGLAAGEGLSRLTVGVAPGDPVLERFVGDGHFEVAAFQMRLELDDALPDEAVVGLVPMDEQSLENYLARATEAYAVERELAGESRERAQAVAREQMDALLPQGPATSDQHFFCGMVGGERVGVLWLGTERPLAFVYDVEVDEAHQRLGYGAGLMRAGAQWARERGAPALGLNVFGYNHAAKALYDRLGYHVVEEYAARAIEPRT